MRILIRHDSCILVLATVALSLLLSACKNESSPVAEPDGRPILTPANYAKVVLALSNYDVVRVTHQMGLDLRTPNLVGIGIGTKDSATFQPLLSIGTTYDPNSQTHFVHYDFTVRLDSSLIRAPLTIRYLFANLTYADVDTTVLLYKYPYHSAEVFATDSIMVDTGVFLDIDRIGMKFFFISGLGGFESLYEYDLSSHVTRRLSFARYGTLAADSVFVFFSSSGVLAMTESRQIQRYNLLKDSVDLGFPSLPTLFINGLATYHRHLYAKLDGPSVQVFTSEATPVDTIPYPRPTFYMTIQDSIIYSVDGLSALDQIGRFDLRTGRFLSNLAAPAKFLGGIKIHDDQLYYCNNSKNFVGTIPISDLVPVQNLGQ